MWGSVFCTIATKITTLTLCSTILTNLVRDTCLKMDVASSNPTLKIVLRLLITFKSIVNSFLIYHNGYLLVLVQYHS